MSEFVEALRREEDEGRATQPTFFELQKCLMTETAAYWSLHLGIKVSPQDVRLCLDLMDHVKTKLTISDI